MCAGNKGSHFRLREEPKKSGSTSVLHGAALEGESSFRV